jgi:putative phosphoesterase
LRVLACLYDVHGNLPALEAVLADAGEVDGYVLGGDYALFGGWPSETVARLRELEPATWIRGNVDRWTADPAAAPDDDVIQGAIGACAGALGADVVAELGALPERAEAGGWLVVHGSPKSDLESFAPEPTDHDAELLAGEEPAHLVFGHTHVQFLRSAGGTELLNPGSVGIPLDGDHRAAYALLGEDGVELRRVAYDWEASARRIREFGDGAAWTETPAGRLERAAFA